MDQSVGLKTNSIRPHEVNEPASGWRSSRKPVTPMGRVMAMAGADAVGGDRMIHKIKRCEMGRPNRCRESVGSQSFHSSEEAR